VALEFALQVVFDHAKSQLPEAVRPRVIQRWQLRGHGNNLHSSLPAARAASTQPSTLPREICQPERVSGGTTKRARRS